MMDFSKNDFSKARSRDKVWSMEDGFGFIDTIYENCFSVKFENGHCHIYSRDGRNERDALLPVLFWNEIHFDIPAPPKRKVKKPVEFWVLFTPNGRYGCATECAETANAWIKNDSVVKHYIDEIEALE